MKLSEAGAHTLRTGSVKGVWSEVSRNPVRPGRAIFPQSPPGNRGVCYWHLINMISSPETQQGHAEASHTASWEKRKKHRRRRRPLVLIFTPIYSGLFKLGKYKDQEYLSLSIYMYIPVVYFQSLWQYDGNTKFRGGFWRMCRPKVGGACTTGAGTVEWLAERARRSPV